MAGIKKEPGLCIDIQSHHGLLSGQGAQSKTTLTIPNRRFLSHFGSCLYLQSPKLHIMAK